MTVFLEMIGQDKFAISLHGFFSHELKDAIKSVEHAKFDHINKVWMLPNCQKHIAVESIRRVCQEMAVKIVDIPMWVKEYYQNPLPYSLSYNMRGLDHLARHDFTNEAAAYKYYKEKKMKSLPQIM